MPLLFPYFHMTLSLGETSACTVVALDESLIPVAISTLICNRCTGDLLAISLVLWWSYLFLASPKKTDHQKM